jgi:HEAT repeat protein
VAKKRIRSERRDPFKLNEPYPRIAGGASRPSVVLKGADFALVRHRARLERLLLQHDPDESAATLSPRDMNLLRRIAVENAAANHVPAIRRSAIQLLGESPTPDNLSVLTALAVSGEDFYTRSHSLVALGRTGLALAAPLLRDALKSDRREERQAAEAGLRLLGGRVGPAIVTALQASEPDRAVRDALGRVIAALGGERKKPHRRQVSTRENSRKSRR